MGKWRYETVTKGDIKYLFNVLLHSIGHWYISSVFKLE